MTLRDLTEQELEEIRDDCDKDLRDFMARPKWDEFSSLATWWRAGYSACLKRILEKNEKET